MIIAYCTEIDVRLVLHEIDVVLSLSFQSNAKIVHDSVAIRTVHYDSGVNNNNNKKNFGKACSEDSAECSLC